MLLTTALNGANVVIIWAMVLLFLGILIYCAISYGCKYNNDCLPITRREAKLKQKEIEIEKYKADLAHSEKMAEIDARRWEALSQVTTSEVKSAS